MTTRLDTKFVAKTLAMLERTGKAAVFQTYPDADYDPDTGQTTLGDAVDHTHKIIPPYAVDQRLIDGDTVKAGDMETGVAALGLQFTPSPSVTKVLVDGQAWTIIHVQPVYSGDEIALFSLRLRR